MLGNEIRATVARAAKVFMDLSPVVNQLCGKDSLMPPLQQVVYWCSVRYNLLHG